MKFILFLLTILFFATPMAAQEDWKALITKTGAGTFEIDGAQTIDMEKALRCLNGGVQFVDVRRATQFSIAHIPGAVNLDVNGDLTEESLSNHVDKDQKVVFYCSDAQCFRSANASAMAVTWGYTDVLYYADGWSKWIANDYPRN